LEAEAKVMDKKNWIMLTNLETTSSPKQRYWIDKEQKII
jgi:hypothetical protein